MKEILLTSSALILALLVLRRVFRKKISRRLQYALWGLVLLRLLVPANLPAVDFSVLSVSQPARTQVETRLEQDPVYVLPVTVNSWPKPVERYPAGEEIPDWSDRGHTVVAENGTDWITYAYTLEEALNLVWKTGIAAMALWLAISNLGFWVKLRRRRIPLELPDCKHPVYLVESGLVSPCLFGLFRPAVYLTSAALESPDGLRHVLAHEETHARHLDPLWSLLRSVCLAVYWFDPLVWWAAAASKEDCELACDEGALKRLGEDERIPYGRTLLRLIPVRRSLGGVLVTATTMTSDKKRLKERITRIAENRKMKAAALCAVLVVAAAVCVVTFTGSAAQDSGAVPLTEGELAFFNEEYFNPEDIYEEDGHLRPEAMRNMFLSSLYETPADIDLYGLVYMGIPTLADVEEQPRADYETILEQVYGGSWPDCATYEVTSAELDALLLEYTGTTLAESGKVGLPGTNDEERDYFIAYLEDYDTYYWCHGDTNYRGQVAFQSGEREGDLVRLTYDDTFYVDGVKCLTLRDVGEGNYQFVSNLLITPREPEQEVYSSLPGSAPVLTIPLTDLEPYAPAPVEVRPADRLYVEDLHESHHEDHHDGYSPPLRMGGGCRTTEGASTFAWCFEGNIYVSSQDNLLSSFPGDYFLSFSMQDYYEEEFTGLFGYDGVRISYLAERSDSYYCTFNDYYVFVGEPDGSTSVFLLARVYGESQLIDLDGDGTLELAGSSYDQAQLFFQRDGELYQAGLGPLLAEHWKRWDEETWLSNAYDFYGWDAGGHYLYLSGYVPAETSSGMETSLLSFRCLYFDGTNLLLYKPERRIADHVLMTDETLRQPEPVLTAAAELAKASYEQWVSGYSGDIYRPAAEWDNYCVTGVEYIYPTEAGQLPEGVDLAVYNVNCEFHSPTPADVMPAGGTWVDEDGWVGGMWMDATSTLVFQILEDGSYKQLECQIPWGVLPESDDFMEGLQQILIDNGLLATGG